jgi:hypothetical protein
VDDAQVVGYNPPCRAVSVAPGRCSHGTVLHWGRLLATLAIIVWHFYWVIFDPDEYPLNPAWLIGRKAAHRAEERHQEANEDAQKEEPI